MRSHVQEIISDPLRLTVFETRVKQINQSINRSARTKTDNQLNLIACRWYDYEEGMVLANLLYVGAPVYVASSVI